MLKELRTSLVALAALTLLTGVVYPLVVTGVAKVAFAHEAGGSLIVKDRKILGSSLIGQPFDDPKYFFSRLSATAPAPYNAAASSGSNLGPTNPALRDAAKARIEALQALDPDNHAPLPVDLVTASASGLDPHISPAAALYQAPRIARVRTLPLTQLTALIAAHTTHRALGLLGEAAVNVLELNLALDALRDPRPATDLTTDATPTDSAR